jgi:hypothetical protein
MAGQAPGQRVLFRAGQADQTAVFNCSFQPTGIGTVPGTGGNYFFYVTHINAFIYVNK